PETFSKSDLKSLGLMGLYDALQKFDPDRKLKFATYATVRIHGSMMDGLRKEDWLPRTLREKSKQVDKVSHSLEQTLSRKPTPNDIAMELNWSIDDVETVMADTLFANLLSTDKVIRSDDGDETTEIAATVKDDVMLTPMDQVLKNEVKEQLVMSLKKLNEKEQLVISLHYMEELTLTEIGEVMQVTTSRVSQIHKKAIVKLKDILIQLKYV